MKPLSPDSQLIADRFMVKMNELGYHVKDYYGNQVCLLAWLRGNKCIEFRLNFNYGSNIFMCFHTTNISSRKLTIDQLEMLNPVMLKDLHEVISSGKAEVKELSRITREAKKRHNDAVLANVKKLPI